MIRFDPVRFALIPVNSMMFDLSHAGDWFGLSWCWFGLIRFEFVTFIWFSVVWFYLGVTLTPCWFGSIEPGLLWMWIYLIHSGFNVIHFDSGQRIATWLVVCWGSIWFEAIWLRPIWLLDLMWFDVCWFCVYWFNAVRCHCIQCCSIHCDLVVFDLFRGGFDSFNARRIDPSCVTFAQFHLSRFGSSWFVRRDLIRSDVLQRGAIPFHSCLSTWMRFELFWFGWVHL